MCVDTGVYAAGMSCSSAVQMSTERRLKTRLVRRVWHRERSAINITPSTPPSTSGSRSTLTFSAAPPPSDRRSKNALFSVCNPPWVPRSQCVSRCVRQNRSGYFLAPAREGFSPGGHGRTAAMRELPALPSRPLCGGRVPSLPLPRSPRGPVWQMWPSHQCRGAQGTFGDGRVSFSLSRPSEHERVVVSVL